MFDLLDLVNIGVPDNRREAAAYAAGLALLVLAIFGGVVVADASNTNAAVIDAYRAQPRFVRWLIAGSGGVLLFAIVTYALDVAAERALRRRIGRRPRR